MTQEMESFVEELGRMVPFKETTDIGDIVLIAAKEPPMLVYALVTSMERDQSRKDEWWHLGMSLLTVPPQKITWTLRTPQLAGKEIFTMGGEERFLKAVELGERPQTPSDREKGASAREKGGGLKRVK